MKARKNRKTKQLMSSLLAMAVLLVGASVFADDADPYKVTVTSDYFETYDTPILREGSTYFPDSLQSTEKFTLYRDSGFTDKLEKYPRLTSLLDQFKASDRYKNLTEDQKKNLENWMIVDGEKKDEYGDFTGWGRPTVFNIVKADDNNGGSTINANTNNSFLRVKPIAGMSNFALYKKLNLDSNIRNKELTFKVSFKIPESGMKYAGDGFGIWLNNEEMSKISTWNFEYVFDSNNPNEPANSYNKRELMAIKSVREDGKVKIKLYAFGNNVTTETPVVLDKDTEYTYTLTMTPDFSDGYNLSGKLSNGGEDTPIYFSPANWEGQYSASGIPKRADIANMTHMTVMAAHNDDIINGDIDTYASAENEKYINGHSMIYVDDISLTADYPKSEMEGSEGSDLSATAYKNGNKVHVNVKNTAADKKNIKLIAAVYDGDQLKGVKIANKIVGNGTQIVDFDFGEGGIADGNKVKVFIWDSLSNVKPLTTAAEFK